uniref:hypothetical protein n=1 Tax=Paractinoplanes polyasparticus TaxID=2856853 RepID=UPI001C85563A|nr:hypothetical protein [Actinoplanes polyasparticus]
MISQRSLAKVALVVAFTVGTLMLLLTWIVARQMDLVAWAAAGTLIGAAITLPPLAWLTSDRRRNKGAR